jgi:hypothetical protein
MLSEACLDGGDVNHPVRITAPAAKARQFPDSFVAFLSGFRFFSTDSVVLAQALNRMLVAGRPDSVRRQPVTA